MHKFRPNISSFNHRDNSIIIKSKSGNRWWSSSSVLSENPDVIAKLAETFHRAGRSLAFPPPQQSRDTWPDRARDALKPNLPGGAAGACTTTETWPYAFA